MLWGWSILNPLLLLGIEVAAWLAAVYDLKDVYGLQLVTAQAIAKLFGLILSVARPPYEPDSRRRDVKTKLIIWDLPNTCVSCLLLVLALKPWATLDLANSASSLSSNLSESGIRTALASVSLITLPGRALILMVNIGCACLADCIYRFQSILLGTPFSCSANLCGGHGLFASVL